MLKKMSELTAGDKAFVGVKAYNCSLLLGAEYGGVDGFVIFGEVTESDLEQARSLSCCFERWAVRSSMGDEDGESSSAGKYSTVLGVLPEEVPDTILSVWNDAEGCEKRAVLVQRQVDSEVAGVLFTKDPTGSGLLINAALGAGENIVSGSAEPDEYSVTDGEISEKITAKYMTLYYGRELVPGEEVILNSVRTRAIISNNGASILSVHFADRRKPTLSRTQIMRLCAAAQKLREREGREIDIEFSFSEGEMHILQMRPITKAKSSRMAEREGSDGAVIKGQCASGGSFRGRAACLERGDELSREALGGRVLVVSELFPELIYKIDGIGAIVTGKGGILSHAAIMARERGIPCVTGVEDELCSIRDNDTIFVDADAGEVVVYHQA